MYFIFVDVVVSLYIIILCYLVFGILYGVKWERMWEDGLFVFGSGIGRGIWDERVI